MANLPQRCTIKDVAAKAGVAVSTVSYALRNHPSIPPATCRRIQDVAKRMGYRPDPQISALMAHIGRGRPVSSSGLVALIWVHETRATTRNEYFFRQVLAGATERAALRGYRVEEFWPNEDRLSGQRLSAILSARGIRSVLLAPSIVGVNVDYTLGWQELACVVLGYARWAVELDRVAHDHFHGFCECLQQMKLAGGRRPATVIAHEINLRTDHALEAAFITHHPDERRAREFVHAVDVPSAPKFESWFRRMKPDGLLLLNRSMWNRIDSPGTRALLRAGRVWTAAWQPGDPLHLPGVLQRYDLAARTAAEMAISLEQSRSYGVPRHPQWVQIRGDWHDHDTVEEQGNA
ncbi:MAG: LacI family transcriptional regulator [Opitutaceae bacterium]|jgi:LacI family transcriptional regulator|nr:LacI family transcriptional regulator [Opitutaceae bacterium]